MTKRISGAARKLYVPAMSLALVLLIGNWAAERSAFDPSKVAQDSRVWLQTGSEQLVSPDGPLSPAQEKAARDVVRWRFWTDPPRPQILFLGDSQSMEIMDRVPGDMTTPQALQVLIMRRMADSSSAPAVVLASLPALSVPEFLLTLIAAGERPSQRIRVVIGEVAVADWRRLNVRPELVNLASSPVIADALGKLIAHSADLAQAGQAVTSALGQPKASDESVDVQGRAYAERIQAAIEKLAERMPLFRMRAFIRSRLQMDALAIMQTGLHIPLAGASPIAPNAYRASLATLELSLRYARSKGIHVILYLCPVRSAPPRSPSRADVVKIRRDIERLCETYVVKCLDYSDLIPSSLWSKDGAPSSGAARADFAHFTGPAHYILAARLVHDTGSEMIAWTRTATRQAP